MRVLKWMPTLLLLCLAPSVLAQADCPAIVSAALEAVDSVCSDTQRNQLCYGNIILTATAREGVGDFLFEKSGDRVGVAEVESLQLSSLSLDDQAWGVALMKVQANLPNTLPGQNVTLLLFGNVSIGNLGEQPIKVRVTATQPANVRLRPTTDAKILESIKQDGSAQATGRLADNSWLRVQLASDSSSVGWVSASLLNVRGDVNTLPVVQPGAPVFGPMQAFTFVSGVGDSPCAGAPDSGLLIQTPKGRGLVKLEVNGVKIELGSTVYLQAQPGDSLYVTVIEGQAEITAANQAQVVPAGTVSTVPLDSSGQASGAPTYPQPYDTETLDSLPLDVLPIETTLAAPPEADDVDEAVAESEQTMNVQPVASQNEGQNIITGPEGCNMTPAGGESINVYLAPSRSATVVAELAPGAGLHLMNKTTIGWYHTTWFEANNVEAWVAVEDVTLYGPCDSVPLVNP
jgi:hypothetical protein